MRIVKLICTALSAWLILHSLFTANALAQSVFDTIPPVIELEETREGVAGETQVFTVQVTDDQSLRDVKLYYRFGGQIPFDNILMTQLAGTEYFSANVATEESDSRRIEYYIQARDNGGNRVIKGFAFEPLVRHLAPAETAVEAAAESAGATAGPQAETQAEPQAASSGFNWWYLALGVLLAGGLAATAGGGGDGGTSDSPVQVPVVVTVANP